MSKDRQYVRIKNLILQLLEQKGCYLTPSEYEKLIKELAFLLNV